jgi:uncharacterized protein (DUF1330 family)
MPAYAIAELVVTNPTKFAEYATKVAPMIAKHGGRYLTKGAHKMPEGSLWTPELVLIMEFPDMNAVNAWYTSPEYQPLKELRKQATGEGMLFFVEGV